MPSPLAEAFLMGILNGCYETPSYILTLQRYDQKSIRAFTIFAVLFVIFAAQ